MAGGRLGPGTLMVMMAATVTLGVLAGGAWLARDVAARTSAALGLPEGAQRTAIPEPACPYGCADTATGHPRCAVCEQLTCSRHQHRCDRQAVSCPVCGANANLHPVCGQCGTRRACPYVVAGSGARGLCRECLQQRAREICRTGQQDAAGRAAVTK
jgi:hypothetical protein